VVSRRQEAENQRLVELKSILEAAAEDAGIDPSTLSRAQFRELRSGISDRETKKYGGFSAFMEKLFPERLSPPAHPLKDIDKFIGHKASEKLAEAIADCAEQLEIEPCEVSFAKFKHYINLRYGQNDKGLDRFAISDAGGFNAVRDAYYPPKPTRQLVDKRRLSQQAAMNRRLGAKAAELQFTMERLEEFSERCFSGRITPIGHPKKKQTKRILNLFLSDLHIGSDIDGRETGSSSYGVLEEARRLAYVVKTACNYKREHRENTKLHLYLAGDLYDGVLHDGREGAVLSEQMARAFHLLSQVIAHLAAEFPEVEIFCTTGNHERWKSRHKERATFQKYDSGATLLYLNLRSAFKKYDNVTFVIPRTPFISVPLFDAKAYVTHGDTTFNTGNVAKTISVGSLENQTNRINASLKNGEHYSLFVLGHVHQSLLKMLDNGSAILINGALCPVNPFAVACGVMESQCIQSMWESTPGHPIGDVRFIKVDESTDQDASLDGIIEPWEGF
jgi:hypothetical protein